MSYDLCDLPPALALTLATRDDLLKEREERQQQDNVVAVASLSLRLDASSRLLATDRARDAQRRSRKVGGRP